MNQFSRKLISLEGGEGCGKSSLAHSLEQRMKELGLPMTLSREPGGTKLGSSVRNLFLNPHESEPISTKTEMLLIAAARVHHVENLIAPKLRSGHYVIVDRYIDSTRAYQKDVFGTDEEMDRFLDLCVGEYVPKLTILLDCPVEIAQKRLSVRESNEKLSRLDLREKAFHEQIRSRFLHTARRFPERVRVVDSSLSPEQVFEMVWEILFQELGVSRENNEKR